MKYLLYIVIGISAGLVVTEFLQVPAKYVVLFALIMLLLNQVARYFLRKEKAAHRAPGSVRTRADRRSLPKDGQPLIDPKRLEAIMNRPARPMAVAPERETGTAPFPPVAPQANGRLGPMREETDPFKAVVPPWEPDFFADFVDGMSRPAVIAYRPYPPPRIRVGRSKVGGDPDLPAGMEWPRTVSDARYVKAGMPLHFMAQIDLSELPWRPQECPERGTLLFFARLDEDMLWGEDFSGDPRNDTRVVYDPLSNGIRTPPPDDLGAINGSNNLFDEDFSPPDQPVMRSYPEWPLVFSGFSTMPAPSDLLMLKAPDGYREARDRYYIGQFDKIFPKVFTGRPPSRFFPVFNISAYDSTPFLEKIRSLKPHDETGFPYSPLCINLFCRYIEGRLARWSEVPDDSDLRDFLSRLGRWKDWCSRQHGHDLDAGDARDFIDYLNRFLASEFKHKKLIVDAIQRTLNELINQSGSDPALAGRLPESIYLAGKHQPLIKRESEDAPLPEKPARGLGQPYHQLFGYLSSVQFNIPVNDPNMLLFQLFSDYGSNMMLCDVGEADFFIKPEDLKQRNWDKVVGQTCGG
ncbi:DUF1963 domain-containing protein [uncultured Roseibium sp.]|uniref:DUF1963 domain-containing protein n=1 Tax=uncultured Roseibium sp. TaxID=1936171 RepID=UPI0032166710